MSDPQTAPKSRDGRIIYGLVTALVAAALIYFQPTEFGVKLAILSSLVVACALVPLIEQFLVLFRERGLEAAPHPGVVPQLSSSRFLGALRDPAIIAALVVAVAAPLNTAALANNQQLVLIELGLTGEANAQ